LSSKELFDIMADSLKDFPYPLYKWLKLFPFNVESIGVAEEMAKPKISLKGLCCLLMQDGGTHPRDFRSHTPQQRPMPPLSHRHTLVYLLSKALEDILDAIVKAVNKSAQRCFVFMRWFLLDRQSASCLLDLIHNFSKISEVCFDLSPQCQRPLHRGEPLHDKYAAEGWA